MAKRGQAGGGWAPGQHRASIFRSKTYRPEANTSGIAFGRGISSSTWQGPAASQLLAQDPSPHPSIHPQAAGRALMNLKLG